MSRVVVPNIKENDDCAFDMDVIAVPYELVLKARKITERFNEIIHYSDHFSLSENDGERRFTPDISSLRHTSSVVFEKSILGREQDREKIVEKLFSREGENVGSPISVMAIVGMGGLGKTTVAQLVYNSPMVSQSFDKRAWVCVSEHFDVNTITRNIISAVTDKQCEYTELAELQRKLAEETRDRRVLLVLDDVWNERRDCWELFCNPLSTSEICQIIVTTRSEVVARMIQTTSFYHLDCLNSDESWSLFSQAAFINLHESDISTNLINFGKSIVQKCKGLPLAIKTLGSMLRYETEETRWKDVLESELWELKQPRDEVLPALELSYKHMPVHLRRHFISLSLFPKDYFLNQTKVLHLWKLLDLLDSDGREDEWVTGELYLNELVQRSILQFDPHGDSYLLHDLLHDLACFFAGEEFYRVEGATLTEIPQNVRYLSIDGKALASRSISVFPHSLRAVILMQLNSSNVSPILELPESLFSKCKNLRAIGMSLCNALSYHIGHPKLLRQFYLPFKLPFKLPTIGIGHLTHLHTLPEIYITSFDLNFQPIQINWFDLNIRELRSINKIRELSICGLGNVRCVEDAIEAHLQRKRHLRKLTLSFSHKYFSPTMNPCQEPVTIPHDHLLNSLRPHHSLRKLVILSYNSEKYPCWLGNASFSMLTIIVLSSGGSKQLPKLGALPSLKYLAICYFYYMHSVSLQSFTPLAGGKQFPSLRQLIFQDMFEWSEWFEADSGGFPCLNTLSLSKISKLSSLPLVPLQSLVTLDLKSCRSLATLPAYPALRILEIEDCHALREIPNLPSLSNLTVKSCSGLVQLPTLPSVLKLHISMCPSLISIGSASSDQVLTETELLLHLGSSPVKSAACSLPKLTTLELKYCPNLCALGNIPSLMTLILKSKLNEDLLYSPLNDFRSLESLNIDSTEFTCIPIKQQSLPSLTRLRINNCPDLQYCDGLSSLTSLKHLEVWHCPKLPVHNLHPPQLKTRIIENDPDWGSRLRKPLAPASNEAFPDTFFRLPLAR